MHVHNEDRRMRDSIKLNLIDGIRDRSKTTQSIMDPTRSPFETLEI